MSRRKTAVRVLVILVGVVLCLVGVVHDVINIRSLQHAVARGQVPERMAPQLVANVTLAGAALFLLGLILLLSVRDLAAGERAAWRISLLVGAFLMLAGVAAYLWIPDPAVLIFCVLGGLVAIPLIIWRKDFLRS